MDGGDPGLLVYYAEFFFHSLVFCVLFIFYLYLAFSAGRIHTRYALMFVVFDTPGRLDFGVRFGPGLHQDLYDDEISTMACGCRC